MQVKLDSEQYLVATPEHEEYLRKANRKEFDLGGLYYRGRKWVLLIVALLAIGWFNASISGAMKSMSYRSMHITAILKSMIGELDQQEKIWAEID